MEWEVIEMRAYISSFLTSFTSQNAKEFKLERFVKGLEAFAFATEMNTYKILAKVGK